MAEDKITVCYWRKWCKSKLISALTWFNKAATKKFREQIYIFAVVHTISPETVIVAQDKESETVFSS